MKKKTRKPRPTFIGETIAENWWEILNEIRRSISATGEIK